MKLISICEMKYFFEKNIMDWLKRLGSELETLDILIDKFRQEICRLIFYRETEHTRQTHELKKYEQPSALGYRIMVN